MKGEMQCPNCAAIMPKGEPLHDRHHSGCALHLCLTMLDERGHDLTKVTDLSKIDADAFWEQFGGPMVDWAGEQLGLGAFPDDEGEAQ